MIDKLYEWCPLDLKEQQSGGLDFRKLIDL
jgi:hypothetical protein